MKAGVLGGLVVGSVVVLGGVVGTQMNNAIICPRTLRGRNLVVSGTIAPGPGRLGVHQGAPAEGMQ